MTAKFYKVLDGDQSGNGGTATWSLPKGKRPGAWMPAIKGELVPCENGYHLCRGARQLLEWLGPDIYEAEYRGEWISHGNKIVVREVRLVTKTKWDAQTARLLAADEAERVLRFFEKEHPNDPRPRNTIAAARAFARGEITWAELATARYDACSAAWAAAYDAASAAASAAANAAASAAAGDAWVAAGAAANAAARAAASAAAGTAAGDAAGYAAMAAETAWQARRLQEYLNGRRT